MKSPVAKNMNTFNTPKVEENGKQKLLEKQLDFEMKQEYSYQNSSDEYSLGDVGCGSISVEEA